MNRKILVVDDSNLELLRKQMEPKYEIIELHCVEDVLPRIEKEYTYLAAIILNISMKGMNEFALLKEIKSNEQYLFIPVFLLTMDHSMEMKRKSMEYGANGILTIPYDSSLLGKFVENTISIQENAALINSLSKDRLTGMMCSEFFFRECDELIQSHDSGYYIMSCIDIDNFKVINDQYGIEIGDKVLKHVAECVGSCCQELEGLTCRYSADKFVALYPAKFANTAIVRSNHKQATTPSCIMHPIKFRIGRYLVTDLSISAHIMMERANVAEESIKGRYDIYIAEYSDSMRKKILHEQHIVNIMNEALSNGEFVPFFQPQYNHATGTLIGAEALVRWKMKSEDSDEVSYVEPNKFIPIFEKNGFIYNVDKSIWEQVCIQLKKWLNSGKRPLPVSVNISRFDIYKEDFLETICGLIQKYELPPDLLRLEVTESAFAESQQQIIQVVRRLIEFGFIVEIDDFGSGYSSLNTLKDVPASILKLDMIFFSDTENSERSGSIIESMVRMAKWLGMAVIAEGVEKIEQADYLKSIGCFYIQGYLYAKPMQLEEYERILEKQEHEPRLTRLKTVTMMDSNQFWNPKSIETLIFNSYVGGACILELHNLEIEVLRVNNQYLYEMRKIITDGTSFAQMEPSKYLDNENLENLLKTFNEAIVSKKEAKCELVMDSLLHSKEYFRVTLRLIASTQERFMFYCVIVNTTEQRIAVQKMIAAERKEMESAKQLEVIMNNINGGVSAILINDDGSSRFIFNNERYYELYGYTSKEAKQINLDVIKLIIPEDFDGVMEKVQKLKKDRNSCVIDYRIRKRDGQLVYLRANASLMQMDGYEDGVITSVITDITDEKEANGQLSFLNETAHDILRESDANEAMKITLEKVLHYFDADRSYIFEFNANHVAVNTYEICAEGIPSEMANLQNVSFVDDIFWLNDLKNQKYVYVDDINKIADVETKELLRGQRIQSIMFAPIYRDKTMIGFVGADNPRNVQKTLNRLMAIGDYLAILLDRRELGQKIEQNDTAIKRLMDDTPGGFCRILIHPGNDTVIKYANEGFCFLMKMTYEEIIQLYGTNACDYIHPDDVNDVLKSARKVVTDGGSFSVKCRLRNKAGDYLWTMIFGRFIVSKGNEIYLNAYFADMSERIETKNQQKTFLG